MATEGEVAVYAVGITSLSVCAPADLTIEQVTAEVNYVQPTGISSDWSHSAEPSFATGEPNPNLCERDPGRRHYLFQC